MRMRNVRRRIPVNNRSLHSVRTMRALVGSAFRMSQRRFLVLVYNHATTCAVMNAGRDT